MLFRGSLKISIKFLSFIIISLFLSSMAILKYFKENNYLKWDQFIWVGILCIIICGINVTAGLDKYMDVLFWDESLYLHRGYNMFPQIPRVWGPTYSFWYKILSFFITDKVELYYFNFKLTTILVSLMLFIFLLSCGVQRVLSLIFAILFLSSFINLPIWPRISHFCIIIILSGLIIAKYQKSYLSKFIIVTFALLICGFARPELYLSFIACFIISYILFFLKIKKLSKLELFQILLLTIFVLIVYIYFKTPLNNGDSGRGLGVLVQHIAMNISQWNKDENIFWIDFPNIIKANCIIPEQPTWKEIIQKNATLLEKHFFSNIINYLIQTGKIIISFFAPIFTKQFHWLCLMVCIILFIVYFSYTRSIIKKRWRFYGLIKSNIFTIFILLIFAAVPVFVCIYAYPREHYLVLQVPFLLLLTAIIISSIAVEIEKPIQKIVVISFILFFVLPSTEDFTYFSMFRKEDSLCNQKTLAYIKQHYTTNDSVRIFDVEGSLISLLPSNFTDYNNKYLTNKDSIDLSDFILHNKFDIIYNTPTLLHLKSIQNDTILFDLLNHPEKFNYRLQKTGNFTPTLLIRE